MSTQSRISLFFRATTTGETHFNTSIFSIPHECFSFGSSLETFSRTANGSLRSLYCTGEQKLLYSLYKRILWSRHDLRGTADGSLRRSLDPFCRKLSPPAHHLKKQSLAVCLMHVNRVISLWPHLPVRDGMSRLLVLVQTASSSSIFPRTRISWPE